MTAPVPAGMSSGRWAGALHEREFRLFFTGSLTSNIGTQMAPVAVAFAVLGQGGGAGDLGLVLTAQTVPLIALVLVGGLLGDRFGPRRVMIVADVIRLAAHASLAALLFLGAPPLWEFIVAEVFIGVGDALFGPAQTGLVPQVVSSGRLQQANALTGVALSSGQIIGPAISGAIVATTGPAWALAADAATYFVSALCLYRLRLELVAAPLQSLREQLKAGWREFSSRRWLWVIVLYASVFLMLSFAPLIVVGAVVSKLSYGGAGAWGTILAAEGVGAVLGGLLLLRVEVRRPLLVAVASTGLYVGPIVTLAVRAPLAVVAATAFVAGLSFASWEVLWTTTVQREVPAEVLVQVSAYDWLGSVALLPVGYALAGPLAQVLGLSGELWMAAGVIVVSTLATLAVPDIRRLRAPPMPAAVA